jgi:hypothetical protein
MTWLFLVIVVAGVIAWTSVVIFMLRAAGHAGRIPGPPGLIRWNPFNILVRPDLWTEEARVECIRTYLSLGAFVALVLIGLAVGFVRALMLG